MKKFSIIIPFINNSENIERSFEYILKQKYAIDSIEIVIVNGSLAKEAMERLEAIEKKANDSIVLVNLTAKTNFSEMLNIGLEYVSGDYVQFLRAGDVLHPLLFQSINYLLEDFLYDLISFKHTWVMDGFAQFEDDPFSLNDVKKYSFYDDREKCFLINDVFWNECYLDYVYSRKLLSEAENYFTCDTDDDDSIFTYPLILMSNSLVVIPEHGYCRYSETGGTNLKEVADRIGKNQKAQLQLLESVQSIPELWNRYSELTYAHFIRNYYIHSIDIARTSSVKEAISISQFQIMQFVCLKLVPKWIENDYIYMFSGREIELLQLMHKNFTIFNDLEEALYKECLVSVIITTFNRKDVLPRAIKNVLDQTYKRIELIVVDDGSTDGTEDAVKKIESKDSRIKYIKNTNNSGVAKVRNMGIEASTGEYILYHDDDDMSRLDKIEKQIKFLQDSPEKYSVVYHDTVLHKMTEYGWMADIIPSRDMSDIRKRSFIYPALLPKNFIACTSMLIKKECLSKCGYFDESLFAYEDWDMTLRLSKAFNFGYMKEPLYDYYLSPTGLISTKSEEHRVKVLSALFSIDKKYEADRKSYGIESKIKIVE